MVEERRFLQTELDRHNFRDEMDELVVALTKE